MEIEKLITDTLVEHEHVVPDSDAVFAATRQRIDRRRTVLSRPLAVAAGVVVLTLAAVTAVVLNRPGTTDKAQVADEVRTPTSAAPAGPVIPDLTMPYSLDWLPPGDVHYTVRRINIGGTAENPDIPVYDGEYMLEVTTGGVELYIDVQEFKMSPPDPGAFKSGPGNPVTVGGRQGFESSVYDGPGGYELYLTHPEAGSMYVNVSAPNGKTAPAQLLLETGRRIAEHVRFPGTTTVTPTFGLSELPSGMKVCAFDVEDGFAVAPDEKAELNVSYELGTCDVHPTVNVYVGRKDDVGDTSGQPVQGHRTLTRDEDGYLRLWVLDAVNGVPVVLAGSVPPAELYDLANRLILPN